MSHLEEYGELKVICPVDCGNAPKKKILKELNIALAKKDTDLIVGYINDEILWNIIGKPTIQGKESFFKEITQTATDKISELHIQHIITHGKEAAVNGKIILENENSFSFCHVYNFTSAGKNTIKEITSYILKT